MQNFYLLSKIVANLLSKLPLLGMLSLSNFRISEVPESIGTLSHFRYLNLSQIEIEDLPENISNLYNLETLILFGCWNLSKLPNSFSKLKNLRHLDIRETLSLNQLPLGIGDLKSLQTLSRIIIGGSSGFEIMNLKDFENLRGEVSIEGLEKVQNATDAACVSLSGCKRCTSLPPLAQLKSLKELFIEDLDGVEAVGMELLGTCHAFPLLEILSFKGMSSWEKWSINNREDVFPCLKQLLISNCSNLVEVTVDVLPPSLNDMVIHCCDCGVLRRLVEVASSVTKLEIDYILGLNDVVWRGVIENIGAVEELSIRSCNEIRYLWMCVIYLLTWSVL
ncbi:hypothetical protein R6Q57_006960 [Mikania cordata]